MSDEDGQVDKGQQEPSMEDILASIRRILSEDEEEGSKAAAAPAPESEPEPEPEPEPQYEPEPAYEPEPEPEPEPFMAAFEPEPESDDVLQLTESMMIPSGRDGDGIVSAPTARASTDVLSDLARAILDRREMAVGERGVTLEAMVRGMLRPLLKEWLDRNLPYLIERLVKKEIDRMVNRAEKLED